MAKKQQNHAALGIGFLIVSAVSVLIALLAPVFWFAAIGSLIGGIVHLAREGTEEKQEDDYAPPPDPATRP